MQQARRRKELHKLQQKGFVEPEGDRWRVTAAGEEALQFRASLLARLSDRFPDLDA